MGRQALSSLWVSLVVRKAGINHDTVQNGLNICKQGEGGDAGTCKLIPAEHSLGGVSSKWIYYFANFRKVLQNGRQNCFYANNCLEKGPYST